MTSPRSRRLEREHEEMLALKQRSSLLTFIPQGTPPMRYEVKLSCVGLKRQEDLVKETDFHVFHVVFDKGFPAVAPVLYWQTPIFHPNFQTPHVCLGDHWYPGWSVAEMCVALCEMVQYKRFNIYDPLDKEAAAWLEKELQDNPVRFPVDRRPVRDIDFEIARVPAPGGLS
jgi:ubiquitin-protein ligase